MEPEPETVVEVPQEQPRKVYERLRQIARETTGPRPPLPQRVVSWPATIPGLGAFRGGQPFERCACGNGTWVFYGATPRCYACAVDGARALCARPSRAR